MEEIPYYRFRKRLNDTAAYRQLRRELIAKEGRCLNCGTSNDLTLDHIVPMSLGGEHAPTNIQILCNSCNASKGQAMVNYELS